MKAVKIRCPYCGALAVKRPAKAVYGANTLNPNRSLYVCSRWPACDAYVGADPVTQQPLGTLANGSLRHARIEAHHAMQKLQRRWGARDIDSIYQWLQVQLNLSKADTHIAKFSEYRCRQVVDLCGKAMQRQNQTHAQQPKRGEHHAEYPRSSHRRPKRAGGR